MKTKFASYCLNGFPEGCDRCLKGKKLVLFISGKCSRNCFYCSLSEKRKNVDKIWANERECSNVSDVLEEIEESNADSAGITGGDPLLCLEKSIEYARAIKKNKNFHIHIYLPTLLVTEDNLRKLSETIDEVRFHPEFLISGNSTIEKDIEKIKLASQFFSKQNIGCELPVLPDRKEDILYFIEKVQSHIGFVNLNEFEISDTNFEHIAKNYSISEDTYTISDSKQAGIWILDQAKKQGIKINLHLCTAETKNLFQYKNRMKNHKILPYGKRTSDGTVIYLILEGNLDETESALQKQGIKEYHLDRKKPRIILSEKEARKLLKSKLKVKHVEEFPTYDQIELDKFGLN